MSSNSSLLYSAFTNTVLMFVLIIKTHCKEEEKRRVARKKVKIIMICMNYVVIICAEFFQ